jgi:hypothetical protein
VVGNHWLFATNGLPLVLIFHVARLALINAINYLFYNDLIIMFYPYYHSHIACLYDCFHLPRNKSVVNCETAQMVESSLWNSMTSNRDLAVVELHVRTENEIEFLKAIELITLTNFFTIFTI